jgi:hypothetical protein
VELAVGSHCLHLKRVIDYPCLVDRDALQNWKHNRERDTFGDLCGGVVLCFGLPPLAELPSVSECVVGITDKKLRDLIPFRAELVVLSLKKGVLLRPRALLELRFAVVFESFAALPRVAVAHEGRDLHPVLLPQLPDEI